MSDFKALCVYGGVPYLDQERALAQGIDVRALPRPQHSGPTLATRGRLNM
jgi:hypothetical protein